VKVKHIALAVAVALGAGAVMLPSPIDAVSEARTAAEPMVGVHQPNDRLQAVQPLALPAGASGPEDIELAADGCTYTGVSNGDLLRHCGGHWELLANTGGRPLGLSSDTSGAIYIADGVRGLLKWADGELTVLARSYRDALLGVVDDVDVSADGTLFFSDASQRWPLDDYVYDVLEGQASGRLFALTPDGDLTLLADDLAFANGVAVSADQSFVLVNETGRSRITRVWLTGEKAGQKDIFADGLPAIPDGVSAAPDGTFWVAMVNPRSAVLDGLAEWPWLREQVAKLPASMLPLPPRYGMIVQYDATGEALQSLQDRAAVMVWEVTSVQPANGSLYLGTLHGTQIFQLPL